MSKQMSDQYVIEAVETAKDPVGIVPILAQCNHCSVEEMQARIDELMKNRPPEEPKRKKRRTKEEMEADAKFAEAVKGKGSLQEEVEKVRKAEPGSINGGEHDVEGYEPKPVLPTAVSETIAREIYSIQQQIARLQARQKELMEFLDKKSA